MTAVEIQRMFDICKGCDFLDDVSGECWKFERRLIPHLYLTHGACAFNMKKFKVKKVKVRVGQQKGKSWPKAR
jgi:hypothetical protein